MAMPGNMDQKNPCDVCGKRDDCMSAECCFNGWESPDCRNYECMLNVEGTCIVNVTDVCGAHK